MSADSRVAACALAIALAVVAAGSSRAGALVELGGGATREDRPYGIELPGVHVGIDVAAQSWGSAVVRVDAAQLGDENFGSVTVGPRLGSIRGRVRPYFDACFGFSAGTLPGTGFVAGYGAGARVVGPGRLGAFVHVRSLGTANMEYSSHVAEWRLGLTFTRVAPAASASAAP